MRSGEEDGKMCLEWEPHARGFAHLYPSPLASATLDKVADASGDGFVESKAHAVFMPLRCVTSPRPPRPRVPPLPNL